MLQIRTKLIFENKRDNEEHWKKNIEKQISEILVALINSSSFLDPQKTQFIIQNEQLFPLTQFQITSWIYEK